MNKYELNAFSVFNSTKKCAIFCTFLQSPPTRGAWIEILLLYKDARCDMSRLPHGGRGLKFEKYPNALTDLDVASHTGGVD